jgi:hypothetical protein
MPIAVECECGRRFRVREEAAGRKVKCPDCGAGVWAPDTDAEPAVAAGPPRRARPPAGLDEPPRRDARRDDEGDDRPRKKKRKKSNAGLIVGLSVGGGLLLVGVIVVIILVTSGGDDTKGGGGFGPGPGGRPGPGGLGPGSAALQEDLRQLGRAFHDHCDAKRGPPRNAADLAPFLGNRQSAIAPLTDGRLVFNYSVGIMDMVAGTSNTVLAYERDAPARGGLVLFGDGSVRAVNAGEFAGLEQARPRKK